MMTTTTVAQMLIRATGLIQIVLGVLFWTGNAMDLIPVHMVSGFVLVVALWVMAAMAAMAGANTGMAILTVLWGFLVVALGVSQTNLLVGELHWVVQVVHLLVGVAAIGLAEGLAGRIRSTGPQAT